MRIHLSVLLAIVVFVIVGCNYSNQDTQQPYAEVIDGARVAFYTGTNKVEPVSLSMLGGLFSGNYRSCDTLNAFDLMKSQNDKVYEMAYEIAKNGGNIPVKVVIANKLDTTVVIHHDPKKTSSIHATFIDGTGARLVGRFDEDVLDEEVRKWAYRKLQNNLGDSLITDMRLYARELLVSPLFNDDYVVIDDIPVYKSLSAVLARVSSNLKADYYYLLCCKDEEELDSMIELLISRKFEHASTTLNEKLNIFRMSKESTGNLCVFLVGINDDWSSTSIPCGVICLDEMAPLYSLKSSEYNPLKQFFFRKRSIRVTLNNTPFIAGTWTVLSGVFEGWNPYSVPYTIQWSGDLDKIVIYTGRGTSTTVSVKGKRSPIHQTIKTYLNFGDNYIQIEAYDLRGNLSKHEHHIATERVVDDTPQINNDITIWN